MTAHPLEGRPGLADTRSVPARARNEEGFGLIELLISMTVLNVALLALIAALSSGAVALQRASTISTASALADAQMERYRALRLSDIRLDATEDAVLSGTPGDAVYKGDPAWNASASARATGSCAGIPAEACDPSRAVTGPDRRSYRIDTYIVNFTPPGGREHKRVTVVVREANNLAGRPAARLMSVFDPWSG